mmetsp:Transcript_8621/g.12724  ORF Transcript_8621/g.12724 Transcript_8621/m.12724 type:complete len:420 (+) Transcript_8621:52-1311(+)
MECAIEYTPSDFKMSNLWIHILDGVATMIFFLSGFLSLVMIFMYHVNVNQKLWNFVFGRHHRQEVTAKRLLLMRCVYFVCLTDVLICSFHVVVNVCEKLILVLDVFGTWDKVDLYFIFERHLFLSKSAIYGLVIPNACWSVALFSVILYTLMKRNIKLFNFGIFGKYHYIDIISHVVSIISFFVCFIVSLIYYIFILDMENDNQIYRKYLGIMEAIKGSFLAVAMISNFVILVAIFIYYFRLRRSETFTATLEDFKSPSSSRIIIRMMIYLSPFLITLLIEMLDSFLHSYEYLEACLFDKIWILHLIIMDILLPTRPIVTVIIYCWLPFNMSLFFKKYLCCCFPCCKIQNVRSNTQSSLTDRDSFTTDMMLLSVRSDSESEISEIPDIQDFDEEQGKSILETPLPFKENQSKYHRIDDK